MPSTVIPQIQRGGRVVVTGSVAFDNILDFPGAFEDHILPDKLHVINISFLVEKLKKQRGGCAGNIAYTMALLGERPRVVAAVGSDFAQYRCWLEEQGVDTGGILTVDDEMTATCFITTDRKNCQITGFYVGAMKRAREISLLEAGGDDPSVCVVAPDDPEAMVRHCREARQGGLPFLFDPSFQVTAMDGESLAEAAQGAAGLFLNDYEWSVLREKTGKTGEELQRSHAFVVITLGEKGSEILLQNGETVSVPAAAVKQVRDPTGAGDAYRGGFVAGLVRGYELPVCARMGGIAAVYGIEHYGTQQHCYTTDEFFTRYRENFGTLPF